MLFIRQLSIQYLTGLIATAAGALKALRLRIPNFIESIRIHMPVTSSRGDLLNVSATAISTGVETMNASVEARSHNNEVFMQVQNVRLVVPFQNQELAAPERHPMLRVVWNPDITMMNRKIWDHSLPTRTIMLSPALKRRK